MYINTVTISSKGQVLLPKKARDLLGTNIVSVEVNDKSQLVLSPTHSLGGVFEKYKKKSKIPFDEIRNQSWSKSYKERIK